MGYVLIYLHYQILLALVDYCVVGYPGGDDPGYGTLGEVGGFQALEEVGRNVVVGVV